MDAAAAYASGSSSDPAAPQQRFHQRQHQQPQPQQWHSQQPQQQQQHQQQRQGRGRGRGRGRKPYMKANGMVAVTAVRWQGAAYTTAAQQLAWVLALTVRKPSEGLCGASCSAVPVPQ